MEETVTLPMRLLSLSGGLFRYDLAVTRAS